MTTLRSAVQQYLAMRRRLGFHLSEAGRLLPQFVTFMEQHRASVVTTRLALAWAQHSQTEQPAERARRLSAEYVRHGRGGGSHGRRAERAGGVRDADAPGRGTRSSGLAVTHTCVVAIAR